MTMVMNLATKKFLDEDGLIKLITLIKSAFYTTEEVDELLKKINNGGGGNGDGTSYDDTELRQWVQTNFLEKGDLDLKDYEKTADLLIKLANLKTELTDGASEDCDTFKKVEDLYAALTSTVSEKATKEDIEDMATKTYVDEENEKVIEELKKKCNVVVCDNQYEFDQILTKDNNTIYLIKGDQDTWFSKEDGDELYDFYGELRERVSHLERLNGITTEYNNEENNGDE